MYRTNRAFLMAVVVIIIFACFCFILQAKLHWNVAVRRAWFKQLNQIMHYITHDQYYMYPSLHYRLAVFFVKCAYQLNMMRMILFK